MLCRSQRREACSPLVLKGVERFMSPGVAGRFEQLERAIGRNDSGRYRRRRFLPAALSPVDRCTRFDEGFGHRRHIGNLPVKPHRGIDTVGERSPVTPDPAAVHIKLPCTRTALGRSALIVQSCEVGTVMKHLPSLCPTR